MPRLLRLSIINHRRFQAVYFYQPNLVPSYTYPTSINWGNWWSWNEAASFATDRAYDYVHVAVRDPILRNFMFLTDS